MSVRKITRTEYIIETEEYGDLSVRHEPADWIPILAWESSEKVHDGNAEPRKILNVVYAAVDESPSNPMEEFDGEGKIVLFSHRHSSSDEMRQAHSALGLDSNGDPDLQSIWEGLTEEQCDELGLYLEVDDEEPSSIQDGFDTSKTREYPIYADDLGALELLKLEALWNKAMDEGTIGTKYAQVLDVYEHGGMHISRHGTRDYPDERWDVVRGGGVWIPDEECIKNIDYYPDETQVERWKRAEKYLDGVLESYNAYISGDVYGLIHERWIEAERDPDIEYDDDEEIVWEYLGEEQSCWGFFTSEYTKEAMHSDFGAPQEAVDIR